MTKAADLFKGLSWERDYKAIKKLEELLSTVGLQAVIQIPVMKKVT
jgi:hypothetical protein